ncbi:hypothetical protein [Neisseria weaveri]|nr:hypothetical protein [Neisseria weaveri]
MEKGILTHLRPSEIRFETAGGTENPASAVFQTACVCRGRLKNMPV